MQIDVTVVLRGTTTEVGAWRCETNQERQFLTTDRQENRDATEGTWQQLALDINRLAAHKRDVRVDVFLILRGHLVENLYDIGALTEIVNYARDYSWGGNIYLAWDQKPETAFDRLYKGNEKILEGLFRMLIQSGVTDLIEIQKRRRATGRDEKTILYECAQESEQRRTRLRELFSDDGWRVILRDGAYFLADFIGEFVRGQMGAVEGRNLSVFYDQRPPGGWGQLLRESRLYERGGKLFVAALSRSNPKDARDLEELWGQESPGLKLFRFNGAFEWLYALTRLCQAGRRAAPPTGGSTRSDITWVESARRPAPDPEPEGVTPRLLVTSAFALHAARDNSFREDSFYAYGQGGPDETGWREEAHCLAASREVGVVLRNLPFHVEVEVRHRVTCEQMAGFLKGEPFTAWLYLGHGDRERGLREEQIAQDASPQRWVDCFEDYEARLRLVIFSACESAGIARLFVESGVSRVAVGFEREVLAEATYELSEKVMPAALRGEGGRDAVLDAFQEAVRVLRRRSYKDMGVDRRYSDSEPKAFADRLKSS